ncbi:acyl-CoA carboxylase subunit beta [Lentzea tibetensis]|uniref:Acyl-CoA carboxylase subunit beta n=1 Tax=Lentzea tibetensis TaxID=2591470 RepID=A0A563ES80_9PSEU|nr:carboxyl transferase domain-containing protein [Lentzea tibetensis]TWP50503.1 acyl-CoA carboxylase subunit beta [Lentzea tibetensis]
MPQTIVPAAKSDHRAPHVRLGQLLDDGSGEPLFADDGSRVQVVRGRIDGTSVIAYCTDGSSMGGAVGYAEAMRIVDGIDTAVRDSCPVIGVWHSGGAALAEGVESMDGVGRMFAAMTRASGRIPQLSVVVGPAAGAAAYGPALTDIVIMSRSGRMFVTGPDVVRAVTGEQVDMEELGGGEAHGRKSGVAHVVVDTEQAAFLAARHLAVLCGRQGRFQHVGEVGEDLSALLPEAANRAYDVHPLVHRMVDEFQELQPNWAANIVIGLGRLAGRTVGMIANNPLRKGGCLDSLAAEKAARFVRMCDSFGIPLVVLVDVPGYLPGVTQEWTGVIRRGAKLLHAFAESVVPRVTLVTRKSYGGAYIAMNSRSLGATTVFAWPDAEVAVMGADAAVGILHRKKLAAAPEHARAELRARLVAEQLEVAGGVKKAIAIGAVDEVIAPATTRHRLAAALAAAPAERGRHTNIPL